MHAKTPAFAPSYHTGVSRHADKRTIRCSVSTQRTANQVTRRTALSLGAAAIAALVVKPKDGVLSAPVVDALETVVDERFGYSFNAPTSGWTKNITTVSGMRELLIYTKDGSDGVTNVTMVGTPVQGDYKKLTSFGNMDNIINTVVPSGKGVEGEVISAQLDAAKNAYVIEYTITPNKNEATRHLITVFSLQPGRFLLTLTAQTTQDMWSKEQDLLRRIADSYRIKYLDA